MQLRDYQIDIAAKACALIHQYGLAYLALEVRTGKTLTSLQTGSNYGAKWVLFLTTKKAIKSIEGDYQALAPAFRCDVINYEQLPNYTGDPDLIICDEAHKLSAFPKPAVRTKEIKERFSNKPLLLLSGTPTPESDSQIYHQLWISDRSPFAEYSNFYKWAKDYVDLRKRYIFNREINDYSQGRRDKIEAATRHLFLSYSQEEAGFVQDVKEQVIKVPMIEGTYYLANKLLKERVAIGSDGSEILADTAVKLQQKLHQVFSGTVLTEAGVGKAFDRSKAEYIRDHFAGQKVAIFYKFKAELTLLQAVFGSRITDSPEVFAAAGPERIFCSQVQSGREGINLSTADALIMFNIDFSAVSYQQARARLQSKDRTKECLLYWLFAEGGIEEKIYQTVLGKRDYTLRHFRKDYKLTAQKIISNHP